MTVTNMWQLVYILNREYRELCRPQTTIGTDKSWYTNDMWYLLTGHLNMHMLKWDLRM